MLKITIGWDWFYETPSPAEQAAIDQKRLTAIVREDGDDQAALVTAIKGTDAPEEHTRVVSYDPCIGDCILAVAWDTRFVECEPDSEDCGGWSGF